MTQMVSHMTYIWEILVPSVVLLEINYCTWIGYFDQKICRMGEGNHWMSYFGQGIYKVRENNQNLTGWY